MKKMNKKGFTVVELVIVIAVIGILASVLIPTFSGVVKNAKENAALLDARNAYTASIVANSDNDSTNDKELPTDSEGKYYVIINGINVVIENGTATIAAEDETFTANCEIADGYLVAINDEDANTTTTDETNG